MERVSAKQLGQLILAELRKQPRGEDVGSVRIYRLDEGGEDGQWSARPGSLLTGDDLDLVERMDAIAFNLKGHFRLG